MADITAEQHKLKMEKKKSARDKMLSRKNKTKGLIMVHTGRGKGKTTAAMGLAIRAMGNDMRTGIIQFVKGGWQTGEKKILQAFPNLCTLKVMGEGFTWETQDRNRDIEMATKAWEAGKKMILSNKYPLVILDEINIVLRYDYLDVHDVIATLQQKPETVHVVLTGRNAKPEVINIADLVTIMDMKKHHFHNDIKAQIGIEF